MADEVMTIGKQVTEAVASRYDGTVGASNVYLRIAMQALSSYSQTADVDEDSIVALKEMRRKLRSMLKNPGSTTDEPQPPSKDPVRCKKPRVEGRDEQPPLQNRLDFGQYKDGASLFHGDTRKAEKFAKLLGGGKEHKLLLHNTVAQSATAYDDLSNTLERQFQEAMQHKGKRGIGST